ncbi:hypothetical protein RKD28_000368 [Streptomyces sp. SAI-229]|jgi:hypothetical protein
MPSATDTALRIRGSPRRPVREGSAAVFVAFVAPASSGAGHNNFFEDHRGGLWATFFRNPAQGYWKDPARVADAAVPGVVRLEWTGGKDARLYVERRDAGR